MRLAKDFQLRNSVKALYCALVRPVLEYGCVVWDPRTANLSRQLIERAQRKFLRFAILKIYCLMIIPQLSLLLV